MSRVRSIEIRQLASVKGGMIDFYTPQSSNETIVVEIPAGTIDDLFVHKTQTDQLLVVKGSFVLVTLINGDYQYIALSDRQPQVVTIPPGVLHGAINLNSQPCVVVNALIRHKPQSDRDYIPKQRPFPYDLAAAAASMQALPCLN